jgi:hypothetical protein
MKTIIIIILIPITLLVMFFQTKFCDANKVIDNESNHQKSTNLKGLRNTVVIGTSATSFPGNFNYVIETSNNNNIFQEKLNSILEKYKN